MKNILSQEKLNQIEELCKEYNIQTYDINNDGTIDVDGDVNLSDKYLPSLPVSFNKVSGIFSCFNNRLTSLKGAPKYVGKEFNCQGNRLTSLEYCPEVIGGDFICSHNHLSSLQGCPKTINDYFACNGNPFITTLEHFPTIVFDPDNLSPYNIGANKIPMIVYDRLLTANFTDDDATTIAKIEKYNVFIKYQDHYDVWTNGFNEDNFHELMDEIEEGLL